MAEGTFDDITERLDQIIAQVRSKDTSLERSLDLFDEAIELGSRAVDMVDSFELSPREVDMLDERESRDGSKDSADTAVKDARTPEATASSDGPSGADSSAEDA